MISLKTTENIVRMRRGGAVLARILDELSCRALPGVSTEELNDEALARMERYDAEPVLLGYRPTFARRSYPAAICTSLNDEVVHGIPSAARILREGDILGIDVSIGYEGMIVDSARTLPIGRVRAEARALLEAAQDALAAAVAASRSGAHLGDIGAAIESLARARGYGVVTALCGHGVGYAVHEEPMVPNVGVPGAGIELRSGLTLAIEPMFTLGSSEVVFDEEDGYTVRTKDGSLSAHFEHTVVITEDGSAEILTLPHPIE